MPVLGTKHHESVFGKHTGTVRTAHDVVPVDTSTDQAFFRETTDRTINVVETLGDQNRHLADQVIQLKEHLRLTQEHMKSDDAEILRCKEEIKRHLDTIDQLENQNDQMSKDLNNEREAHRVTTQKLVQTTRELDHANEQLIEARTVTIADLEKRNRELIEEAKQEKNRATTLAQRLSASETRCQNLTNQCERLQASNNELCADNNMLLGEKETLKETLAREKSAFEEGIHSDRVNAQNELNKIAGNLQARLAEQSDAYRQLFEEHQSFQAHANKTADEYKAFVDSQNDEIKRLVDLSNAQADEIKSLFDSEMATRRKMEAIEDTVYTTEQRVGLTRTRSPIRNRLTDERLHNRFM